MLKFVENTFRNTFIAGAALLTLLLSGLGFANAQSGPNWLSLDEGQSLASSDKKVLFIFVEAEWCAICKRMKKEVFPDADILSLLEKRFATVSIDLDSKHSVVFNGEDYTERSFAKSMNVIATPTMIFADHEGKILGGSNGFYDEDRFLLLLSYLDSDQFQKMSFDEFEKERTRR
jgi:thioredoxin-related protein